MTRAAQNAAREIGKSVARLETRLCAGCGACAAMCPHSAISMSIDWLGFLRSAVDAASCVNCGICADHCPVLRPDYSNLNPPDCYAALAADQIRKISSSGGAFSVAAQHVLEQGGVVAGVAFDEKFAVEFRIVDDLAHLGPLRGSKYIQANAAPVLPRVKNLLGTGKLVLFTGLPCQVAGLKAFLGKLPDNLITMEVLCHGISSYKIFQKYRQDTLKGKEITDLQFKAKSPWGWHAGLKAAFADGSFYAEPLERDPFYQAYLGLLSRSDACANCPANHLPRQADIMIADFWGVEKFNKSLNDDKGTSLVLINSEKGKKFFAEIREKFARVMAAPLDIAISCNGAITNPYVVHKNAALFRARLDDLPFAGLVSGCLANRIYEQEYLKLCQTVAPADHELYYLARYAARHAKGREIVTWIRSEKFESILRAHFNLEVAFGVTWDKRKEIPGKIEPLKILKGNRDRYFLVSLHRHQDADAERELNSYGFVDKEDCIFRVFKPIEIINWDLGKANYYDEFGNSIEGYAGLLGRASLRGFNNHVMFGHGVRGLKNLNLVLDANSLIDVKAGCNFISSNTVEMFCHDHAASLRIGANCHFDQTLFRVYAPGAILINESCTFNKNTEFHANEGKAIIIGRDCMGSYNLELWAGNGHGIFDSLTGARLNRPHSDSWSVADVCVVGEHVWLGNRAMLMHGTNIGNGSIVGMGALVKGEFPNNCAIGGNPARILKENTSWHREAYPANLDSIAPYNYPTSHAKAPISGRKVLLVGGNRVMGRALARVLLDLGNELHIANRGNAGPALGMEANYIRLDADDAENAAKALKNEFFDVVFDNIAYCSKFARNILDNVRCARYVQLSSIAVYGRFAPELEEGSYNPCLEKARINEPGVPYYDGKRQSEALAFQQYARANPVAVRIPYVIPTERILFYCQCVLNGVPIKLRDRSHGMCFVRGSEVGKFLPWIAAQAFCGPINFASAGWVTDGQILDYIAARSGQEPVLDAVRGKTLPFDIVKPDVFLNSASLSTLSLNLDRARRLGWRVSSLDSWFWQYLDQCIVEVQRERARTENF